uniref:THD domain-containing protein n=1 Tax=Paramormyrops kingsleyae TaxID=1676925 RepID=A0A3B3QR74_9TELE
MRLTVDACGDTCGEKAAYLRQRTCAAHVSAPFSHSEAVAARGQEGALPNAHLTGRSRNAQQNHTYSRSTSKEKVKLKIKEQFIFNAPGDAYLHLFSYDEERHALIVPENGRYSIYLQVTYREPYNHICPQSGLIRFLQAVYVWSDSYMTDRILMKAKDHVHCGQGVRTVTNTGVYSLEAGDRLMVYVSLKNLLEIDEKSLYFGAFLLSRGTDA